MSYSIYKVKSKAFNGTVYLRYHEGELTNIELPEGMDSQVFDNLFKAFRQKLPVNAFYDLAIGQSNQLFKMEFSPLAGRTVKEKTILFCAAHKNYRRVNYTAKDREKANLKAVPVTPELLDVFFSSPLQHFTIDNYVSRINITRDWQANGMPTKDSFRYPKDWSADFERTLSPDQLTAYHQHLRKLGYIKDYNPNRGTFWREAGE